jgi:UDP-N-acetylglucosamine--N-acetylmuramyl-(pentapeptide) pyrophosphoryl-undecaprenol N-acetylglucosamine transferase
VREYIESIKEAYEWCDIVICRGGAITISEIMNLGKASIIVPYPHATDNHQMKNCKYLQNKNAAIVINQKNFTKEYLASLIISFIDNPKVKDSLSENIIKLNKKDVSKNICMEIINELGVE